MTAAGVIATLFTFFALLYDDYSPAAVLGEIKRSPELHLSFNLGMDALQVQRRGPFPHAEKQKLFEIAWIDENISRSLVQFLLPFP